MIGYYTSRKYPDNLRLVVYEDFRDGTVYRFLTNNFTLEAITIAELYRERWQNPSLYLISNSIGQILFKRGDIRDIYNKPEVPLDVPEEGSARQLTLC